MSEDLVGFIEDLRKLSAETEWVEFKTNDQSPEKIGEYLSALSNSACLHQKQEAYLVFGIENQTHKVLGTTFDPYTTKGKGAEDLLPWLHRLLSPAIEFSIKEINYPEGRIVIFLSSRLFLDQ